MIARYSRDSVRRLIKKYLSIDDVRFFYHQTLTLAPLTWNEDEATPKLNALLSNLHHRYEMASIYVRDYHRNGAVHFHVWFMFFDQESLPFPPSRMVPDFGTVVFQAWRNVNDGRVIRKANKMRARQMDVKTLYYPLKYVRRRWDLYCFGNDRWWGYRNGKLMKAHSTKKAEKQIRESIDFVLRHRRYKNRKKKHLVSAAEQFLQNQETEARIKYDEMNEAFDTIGKGPSCVITSDEEFCSFWPVQEHTETLYAA